MTDQILIADEHTDPLCNCFHFPRVSEDHVSTACRLTQAAEDEIALALFSMVSGHRDGIDLDVTFNRARLHLSKRISAAIRPPA